MRTSLPPRRLCRYWLQFPHQPRPFSSGKALRLSTSLPCQSSVCCQVSSFKAEGLVAINPGSSYFSWKEESHFIAVLGHSISVVWHQSVDVQRRFGDGICTLQLHSAVHDTFWVTAVIYKEVFGFIIPPYILIRGRGLTWYMKCRLEAG